MDDGAEDLRTRSVVPEEFFSIFPEIKDDGRKHRISAPSEIFTIEVSDREKIYFSVPNPCSCQGLDPLGDFLFLAATQSSRR